MAGSEGDPPNAQPKVEKTCHPKRNLANQLIGSQSIPFICRVSLHSTWCRISCIKTYHMTKMVARKKINDGLKFRGNLSKVT